MKRIFLGALSIAFIYPDAAIACEQIFETKNICGRYYASEINGVEAARLLGLTSSARLGSRVEQYCNFFR